MYKNPVQTFTMPPTGCSGGQRGPEDPLESREYAFGLPAMTVHSARKTLLHLATIAAVCGLTRAPGVHRDDGGADAQLLAAEPMVRLRVIGTVAQQPVDREPINGLRDGGLEIRRIVARPGPHPRGSDEMRVVVADDRQLGPPAVPFGAAPPMQEVPADVMTLQAGGINAGLALVFQQASGLGDTENSVEQQIESPFFRSRCSA